MKINNQIIELIAIGLGVLIVVVVMFIFLLKKRRKLDNKSYKARWKAITKLLAHKTKWKDAVILADNLLDEILKKKHYKGKTMGERMVSAQHDIKNNDMLWFSHKFKNKIINDNVDLNKNEVKKTLLGFWQALKDLGAFDKDEK